MTKKYLVATISCVLFLLLSFTGSWAEDPSGLIIVRASDGSLWKATCLSNTCTSFSSFPGNFDSQPTVFWDERLSKYVLWGRASDNSIWRCTFTSAGVFDNNWTSIAGATSSPIGAAGGYFPAGSNSSGSNSIDVSTLSDNCSSQTNLATVTLTPKRSGDFSVFATGLYHQHTLDAWVRVCISNQSAGDSCSSWSPFLEPPSIEDYENEARFALDERFAVSADTSYTFYLKACRQPGATGSLLWNDFIGIFTTREY
jgi:hypothetical protein